MHRRGRVPGMVESADIRDETSLEAWLENQPRKVAVRIASRAAQRVLPLLWSAILAENWGRRGDLTALAALRSNLISSVAAKIPTDELKDAADATTVAYPAIVATIIADAISATNAAAADVWESVRTDAAQVSDGEIPWFLPL